MNGCACTNACKACKETKAQLEIYRLKELLCVIRECAVSDFDDRAVKLAGKGIGDDFHIPLSRFKEILESL